MRILKNNLKVLGVFLVISILSLLVLIPIWNLLEARGDSTLTGVTIIVFTSIVILLHFISGRYLLYSSGNYFYDILSFLFVIIVYIISIIAPRNFISTFFYSPFLLLIITFKNQLYGVIIASLIPIISIFIGFIVKNKKAKSHSLKR